MKRYIVFGGMDKLGGWLDYLGHADSIESACQIASLVKMPIMWWHVVDSWNGEIVQDDVSESGNKW